MSKSTPGPWSVTFRGRTIWICSRGLAIAQLTDGVPEQKANAQLLAAAPELLQACRAAYADVIYDESESHALSHQTLELLCKAFAKAEGEQ